MYIGLNGLLSLFLEPCTMTYGLLTTTSGDITRSHKEINNRSG